MIIFVRDPSIKVAKDVDFKQDFTISLKFESISNISGVISIASHRNVSMHALFDADFLLYLLRNIL